MRAKRFYNSIQGMSLQCSCPEISITQWDQLMKGHKRANKKRAERLIKQHLPGLFDALALEFYNPYNCLRTETHLIYVHSGIEYFIKIN